MKLIMPREHGAWAMWLAPLIIGISVTRFKIMDMLLLIVIFFAFLSLSPFFQGIRRPNERKHTWKYAFIYLIIAIIIGLPVLYFYPKLIYFLIAIIPLFSINIYYAVQKNERALINDIAALLSLSSSYWASYYIGNMRLDDRGFIIWISIILFFLGSIFYVKSVFRERNNKFLKFFAMFFMLALMIYGYLVSGTILVLAYLFSTFRYVFSLNRHLTPKWVGIIEIINTILFIVFLSISNI